VERAICLRRLQLENPANYRNEVRAMEIATQAMDAIKVQKLGMGTMRAAWHDCREFLKTA
jgi:hypothetical protein